MKKILIYVLILIMTLNMLTSCSSICIVEEKGIENYNYYTSGVETTAYILPSKDFIIKYNYIDGDYYYYNKFTLSVCIDKAFLFFEYDVQTYEEALDFSKENMPLLNENTFEFNGYTFIQQDVSIHSSEEMSKFPEKFWMMFYSEERNIIGFFGYYQEADEQNIRADEDFEGFVKYEFPEYDWEE